MSWKFVDLISFMPLFPLLTGEKLVNFLVEPKMGTKWPKDLPRFKDRNEAIAVCKELCSLQYLLRCEKRGKGELGVSYFVALANVETPSNFEALSSIS